MSPTLKAIISSRANFLGKLSPFFASSAIPAASHGLSIAWAVAEYLHDSPDHAAKTLFATHYHELTELAERLPGAQNYQITATEKEGEVVFLHRLERGRAPKSYGIEVARLAGLPPVVLANAREVLSRLERYELDVFADEEGRELEQPLSKAAVANSALERAATRAARRKAAAQASLFDLGNEKVIDEIRSASSSLTPDEAKELLIRLRDQLL